VSEALVSLWTRVRRRLEAAGVETPVLDARLLVEAGASVSRLDIVTNPRQLLSLAQVVAVDALAARRAEREPMAYILGRKAFWKFDLKVGPQALAPRPETEVLVEAALAMLPEAADARVLDLGVGSGAIVLAILSERRMARGIGVDVSAGALSLALGNAQALGLADRFEVAVGDWRSGLSGLAVAAGDGFDLVVSNPPYLTSSEVAGAAPELRYEPRVALDGGEDGLDAYRAIAPLLPALLKPEGAFALELGAGQAAGVTAFLEAAGLAVEGVRPDLGGLARVVSGRRR
jgi:release factor glutamine methyltransferase